MNNSYKLGLGDIWLISIIIIDLIISIILTILSRFNNKIVIDNIETQKLSIRSTKKSSSITKKKRNK